MVNLGVSSVIMTKKVITIRGSSIECPLSENPGIGIVVMPNFVSYTRTVADVVKFVAFAGGTCSEPSDRMMLINS